jgi:hypothetical protein
MFQFSSQLDLHWTLQIMRLLLNSCQIVVLVQVIFVVIVFQQYFFFFAYYTIHQRHSQHTHTHPYEYTHANLTPMSIFEYYAGKSSRLTKSPQASRCLRERRLPLKAQTLLNPEKLAPTGSRTQDLRCYQSSCNH